jgi:hypothetical protein
VSVRAKIEGRRIEKIAGRDASPTCCKGARPRIWYWRLDQEDRGTQSVERLCAA